MDNIENALDRLVDAFRAEHEDDPGTGPQWDAELTRAQDHLHEELRQALDRVSAMLMNGEFYHEGV